jgi:hypothetical protein
MSDEEGNAAEFGKQPSDDELQRRVVDHLMDALQETCPPFVYFGTLEGDGADFGFWVDMDGLNEALRDPEHTLIDGQLYAVPRDEEVLVQVSDHGNVTVMDMQRNVLWSVV